MKKFFKSFMTSLMIGIPIVIVVCVLLYMNKDIEDSNAFQEESVHLSDSTGDTDVFPDKEDNSDINNDEAVSETSKTAASVTLSFAGDVHFSELVLQNYDKNGILAIVDDEMLSHMQKSDLFMLNHEFVFSNRGEAMEDKEYTLKNDPKYVNILQEL